MKVKNIIILILAIFTYLNSFAQRIKFDRDEIEKDSTVKVYIWDIRDINEDYVTLDEYEKLIDKQDSIMFRMFMYKDTAETKIDSIINVTKEVASDLKTCDSISTRRELSILTHNETNINDRVLISSLRWEGYKMRRTRNIAILIATAEAIALFYIIQR